MLNYYFILLYLLIIAWHVFLPVDLHATCHSFFCGFSVSFQFLKPESHKSTILVMVC